MDATVAPPGLSVSPAHSDLFASFNPTAFPTELRVESAIAPTPIRIFGRELATDAYALAFLAAFVIGILFNVMPCVLPVVPLKAIGFYEVSQHNRAKSLALGAVFSAGLIATFGVLAVLVVVLRKFAWGQFYSNPWFLAAIIGILTVMALGTFGVFNVGLPAGIYRFTPRHDTYAGNFLFGILTAVLSTPCTFGMFLGLLVWAAQQPPALGVALVMTVGLGMATPYFLLSALPELARRFPRSGPWAALVKEMMGFLLLASAVYFARRFIEAALGTTVFWWTLFAVVAFAGLYLIVRTITFSKTRLAPAMAAVIAITFVAPALSFTLRVANPPIQWTPFTEETLASAFASGRPVLVEFTAAWCGNCLALEATVFHDPRTIAAIKKHQVVTLRADVTNDTAPGWKKLRQLSRIGAIPLSAVYLPGQHEPRQLTGIYTSAALIEALDGASSAR